MLHRRLIIDGREYPLAVGQSGKGAPTDKTPGCCGCTYADTESGRFYVCISDVDGKCTWRDVTEDGVSAEQLTEAVSKALEQAKENGDFKGEPGPQGPRGFSGVAVQTAGYVSFNVTEDGILQCTYSGDEQPNYSINSDGHLILEM